MAILKVRDNNGNVTVIPALEGRSAYQIAINNGFIGTEQEWLKSLQGGNALTGTKEEWNNNNTIPAVGELVIITDYKTKENENGEIINVPGLLVGNGKDTVSNLPVVSGSADKLEHTITIGEHVFDGTQDIIIDIYSGEVTDDESLIPILTSLMTSSSINQMSMQEMPTIMTMQETSSTMTMQETPKRMVLMN